MYRIGMLGCGNMGSALAQAAAGLKTYDLLLYDADPQQITNLKKETGASAAGSLEELAEKSNMIILAVKPQILPGIYPVLASYSHLSYISIAAGVPLSVLTSRLGSGNVVRFMPNLAAAAGKSVTAVAAAPMVDDETLSHALALAEAFGTVYQLDESLFSAFTGISGSAIAYFFQFLHAAALGGTRNGIPFHQALSIVEDTCAGALALLEQETRSPADLIPSVTSAAGTTIEGIVALEESGFTASVIRAVTAAADRAAEIEHQA